MFLTKDFLEKPKPQDQYLAKVYDFMTSWRQGKQEFTLQTSGSTGTPKLIQVTRNQLVASALATGKALQLGEGTRALVCLNVNYIAGLMMLVRGMELRWELYVMEPTANPLLSLAPDLQFDFTPLVPMQLATILGDTPTSGRVARLGKILLGGAPVNAGLQSEITKLNTPVYQSYGMTETVSHIALRRLNGPEAGENYFFLPGIEFGTDERGCLFVSGAVTAGALVQTNDLVELEGSTFKWLGRADHVINSGGVKIVLDQVDAKIARALLALGIENPFFSWFVEDEKLGQKLVLVLEGEPPAYPAEEILGEIRAAGSAYETPKHIYFAEQFIKTPTGKVDKPRSFSTVSQS